MLNLVNFNQYKFLINLGNYLADSETLKPQVNYIFNGQIHNEDEITRVVEEISQIKEISSPNFKEKLKDILINSNKIIKYKNELALLYTDKIDMRNSQHRKMLYDIWIKFNKNDKYINRIDKKWCKKKYKFKLYSKYWISRE